MSITGTFDEENANVTVLGQEKGGAILFSWVQGVQLNEQLAPNQDAQVSDVKYVLYMNMLTLFTVRGNQFNKERNYHYNSILIYRHNCK